MNIKLQRHKLLEILALNRIAWDNNPEDSIEKIPFGYSFDDLCKKMNCSKTELDLISSELFDCEEIVYISNMFDGLGAKQAGLTAYSTGKYKSESREEKISSFGVFTKLIIPIIAIIIAIVSLILSLSTKTEEGKVQELQERVEKLESMSKTETKTSHSLPMKTDSL